MNITEYLNIIDSISDKLVFNLEYYNTFEPFKIGCSTLNVYANIKVTPLGVKR